MEIEELLFRKHERDAQRGWELISDDEYIKMEKQREAASKEMRIRPIPDFGIKSFVDAIVSPRTNRMAGAIDRYCIDMEKRSMETAIECHSRVVYVAEWTETVEVETPERHEMQWEMHFMVYPYNLRSWAFKRIQGNGGHVRIINFKQLIAMPEDEFSAIRSENKETAEKLRRHFHGNMQISGNTIFDKLYR